ncbi:hypothetical protein BC939DRAFT_439903 [Gamsiella multidivaricata]|uniref:uncharacterized protein n=1 Tax=Gamsiella multidivaricata TaxID=101098 RepID=UPI00221EEAAD|nr:uncharacterized protein BC939DRAFT_439903 [Gamsiella multidivaricata]KAI7830211.1 hypothetical protein BC939DRAFT_439903 [Gamsiella multidivaricata]
MKHRCWRSLSLLAVFIVLLEGLEAQMGPGPVQSSQTISILGDELYLHGGSRSDTFLETNCTSELWRLRLGHSVSWNLSSATWESVPLREDSIALPPVSGMGLKTLIIPGNNTLSLVNGTPTTVQSISPYMIEFGRAGCADDDDKDSEQQDGKETVTDTRPWIGFNIYNPMMNTWESTDLINATADLGFNATAVLAIGNWLSPTVAVDYVNFAWYIILQSTAPLRQVILRKDLAGLTIFMGEIDLTKSHSTLFPTQLLYEGWNLTSVLNENAPFVGKGVATVVRDKIIIISGTANSFTPGDSDTAELRGCDHAYVFSTTTNAWTRQDLVAANNGALPDTREKAAILAVGSKIYLHGGVKPYQTVLGDLWVLDTDTWTWTQAPDGPGPRADHTLFQYHEYLLAVSGFDVGRNVPVVSVLPIMAYNINTTAWTDTIRATLDDETSFITNITRAAIIIGTITFGLVLLVLALSTHLLRKWNQRNYTKVAEDFELGEPRRKTAQQLPSILKKKYTADDGSRRSGKAKSPHNEVIFEDLEGEYKDATGNGRYADDSEGSFDEELGDESDYKGLLSLSQPNPTSRPPRRVRIEERVEERVVEAVEDDQTDEENEEGQIIVRAPSEPPSRDE